MQFDHKAQIFATAAHGAIGQVRKYTGEPYITHPAAVVKILDHHLCNTPIILAVAWLHDVVEDTKITITDIRENFGFTVASHVADLTDLTYTAGNRATRKAKDRARLAASAPITKLVKAADCIHNLSDILGHDPKFAKVYVSEIQALYDEALSTIEHPIMDQLKALLATAKQELASHV